MKDKRTDTRDRTELADRVEVLHDTLDRLSLDTVLLAEELRIALEEPWGVSAAAVAAVAGGQSESAPRSHGPFQAARFLATLTQPLGESRQRANARIHKILVGTAPADAAARLWIGSHHDEHRAGLDNQLKDVSIVSDALEGKFGKLSASAHEFIKLSHDKICREWDDEKSLTQFISYRISGEPDSPTPSLANRLERLAHYSRYHDDDEVRKLAAILIPEWGLEMAPPIGKPTQPALPDTAPALWKSDKQSGETPPDFIQRVYAPWLGHGLTRAHIKQLDEPLYRSLYKWLSNPRNEMPEDLDLPTLAQQNDRTLARLEAGEAVGEFTMREMGRIRSAMQRRVEKER